MFDSLLSLMSYMMLLVSMPYFTSKTKSRVHGIIPSESPTLPTSSSQEGMSKLNYYNNDDNYGIRIGRCLLCYQHWRPTDKPHPTGIRSQILKGYLVHYYTQLNNLSVGGGRPYLNPLKRGCNIVPVQQHFKLRPLKQHWPPNPPLLLLYEF